MIEIDLSESIDSRIDKVHLEELLHQELEKEGIGARFLFGVYNKESEYILGSLPTEDYVMKRSYSIQLFPKDLIKHQDVLKITFPTQINYIFSLHFLFVDRFLAHHFDHLFSLFLQH